MLFGNEEDFSATLGVDLDGVSDTFNELPVVSYERMLRHVAASYPTLKLVVTTLRTAHSATQNGWGALALFNGEILSVPQKNLEILDRVGGGDSFASGLIYGLISLQTHREALEFAVAAGCLKHSFMGDFNRSTVEEVKSLLKGDGSGRVQR